MSLKPLARFAAVAGVCAVVTATPVTAQRTGSFDATVTATAKAPVQVTGFAPSFSSAAHKMWYTQLITPGGASTFLLLYAGAGRPPIGEHRVADYQASDGDPPAGAFIATGSIDPQLLIISGFHSVTGKVVITSSSADEVEGTFSYRARQATNGQVVNVTGTFKTANKEQ